MILIADFRLAIANLKAGKLAIEKSAIGNRQLAIK